MSSFTVSLAETDFDKIVINNDKPVLVDFWADWCGPCKMIAPILEEIAQEYGEQLVVAKLNVDQNPSISPKFGIRGIPTLLLFKNGSVVATQVGALSKLQLKTFLDNHL
ncbi:thioredoxin TrxA [Orbus sturtevantii]|uniref:thioredoxin TrxA n=1 Tax=Orbus sturtevantii TaxID=3074109 RepID=UPI00370D00BB